MRNRITEILKCMFFFISRIEILLQNKIKTFSIVAKQKIEKPNVNKIDCFTIWDHTDN